ncbi:MAG: hypothetical protein MMC33_008534 [Icmadophila ericetorum]|nr:hypothetical protein [Icmadophila ericetorum]
MATQVGIKPPRPLDDLEEYLKDRARDDKFIRDFLKDYANFKSSKRGIEIIRSIFWYAFRGSTNASAVSQAPNIELQNQDSFSKCLETLKHKIELWMDECLHALHLCIVFSNTPDILLSEAYPRFYLRWVGNIMQSEPSYQSTRLAIVYVLDQLWALAKVGRNEVNYSHGLSNASTPTPSILRLNWQYKLTAYAKDRDTDAPNVLILFRPSDKSTHLIDSYRDKQTSALPYLVTGLYNAKTDMAISVYLVLIQLIEYTNSFLESLHDVLDKLKFPGRTDPSESKLEYLLHLENCRQLALSSLGNVSIILFDVQDLVKDDSTNIVALSQWSDSTKDNIAYLQQELKTAGVHLVSLKSMIKDQLDIRQIRQTRILTILASLFISFSFMASLYGMNLTSPLWPTKQSPNQANWTQTVTDPQTSQNQSSFTQREAEAIIGAIQDSGPFLFSFKSYWYTLWKKVCR